MAGILRFRSTLIVLAAVLPLGCAEKPLAPLPQRTVLYYDYSGAWAATAGNECEEHVDLSEGVFMAIGPDPTGGRGRFYIEYLFLLTREDRAEATVGQIGADGALVLTIDAEGLVDRRAAWTTYDLRLVAKDHAHILVTAFSMTVRDGPNQDGVRSRSVDLLRTPDIAASVPVLSTAGVNGLCLRRL